MRFLYDGRGMSALLTRALRLSRDCAPVRPRFVRLACALLITREHRLDEVRALAFGSTEELARQLAAGPPRFPRSLWRRP